jgi:hypothetical protein
MMGSTGFLLVFMAVNAANLVKARETGSRRALCALGVLVCFLALSVLLWQTLDDAPAKLWVLAGMVGLSILIETVYRRFRPRAIRV